MKTFLVGILFCSLTANAGIKDTLKNLSLKILGIEKTQMIFGKGNESKLSLPIIPSEIPRQTITASKKITSFDGLSEVLKRKYYRSFIAELSYVTRGIRINQDSLAKWLNVMEQGGSQEGIYRAMVLDQTYLNLENFKDPLDPRVIKFVQSYGEKYINRKFKESSLQTLNIYSIKRIITEKTLEVVDFLLKNPDDLYHWYAIFSSELAGILKTTNEVREIKDETFHYRWAQKVPYQHIKSEIIIKLHGILNQLNEKVE